MVISELENTLRADDGSFSSTYEKTKHITGRVNDIFYEIKADVSPVGAVFHMDLYSRPEMAVDTKVLRYSHWIHIPTSHQILNHKSLNFEFNLETKDKALAELLREQIRRFDILKMAYASLEEMKLSGYLDKITKQVQSEEEKMNKSMLSITA